MSEIEISEYEKLENTANFLLTEGLSNLTKFPVSIPVEGFGFLTINELIRELKIIGWEVNYSHKEKLVKVKHANHIKGAEGVKPTRSHSLVWLQVILALIVTVLFLNYEFKQGAGLLLTYLSTSAYLFEWIFHQWNALNALE